jgi:hypothetical protein
MRAQNGNRKWEGCRGKGAADGNANGDAITEIKFQIKADAESGDS